MPGLTSALQSYVRQGPAAESFDGLVASASSPQSVPFRAAYASVERRLKKVGEQAPPVPAELRELARPHFGLTDWVRAALLATALEASPERRLESALALFEGGELGEQESLLRTLSFLPEPALYVPVAELGVRTNAQRLFAAIAAENPYPARHFGALQFNQMVLKAVFVEVSVLRIEGLAERRTPELARMAEAYASERRAAGRPVPEDIARILGGNAR
jgi:hypothetical protein